MLLTDVCTVPPVAAATLLRSSSATRPAQKMSLSAKYCFKGKFQIKLLINIRGSLQLRGSLQVKQNIDFLIL